MSPVEKFKREARAEAALLAWAIIACAVVIAVAAVLHTAGVLI